MHWILILTIFTGDGGASVGQVGPFVNKNNCTKAASKWLVDVRKKEIGFQTLKISALCVQK